MADIIRFFDDGVCSFDTAQTLEIMAIRETALTAMKTPGTWVKTVK